MQKSSRPKKINRIQDKVRGCFLGVAIGDSLGKPVESMSAKDIANKYGYIKNYVTNSEHKWFSQDQIGTTTDDYQLTKSVARALIKAGDFCLDSIAVDHCNEFLISVRGWGGSTREAIERISKGIHWSEAGKTDKLNRGTGNGVAMKVAPVGLWLELTKPYKTKWVEKMVSLSTMTHPTNIGVTSGLAHAFLIEYCFRSSAKSFDRQIAIDYLSSSAALAKFHYPKMPREDDLQERFIMLNNEERYKNNENIINDFNGSCYAYNSLPFSYAFFLRQPIKIKNLYDCLNSGADADTNCSLVASLLGALHGTRIFPQHLINGLVEREEIIDLADQFYKKFKENQ